MSSKAGMTWLLYPLIGPPIGLMTINTIQGIWPTGVGIWLVSYFLGGISAAFVGICAGAYGAWRGNVPFWVPILGAMIPVAVLFLRNFEKLQSRDSLADSPWFTLAIHQVPAIVVWSIIRIVWGPGSTWIPQTK